VPAAQFFIDSGSESGMTTNNEIPHQVRDDKTDGLPHRQVGSQWQNIFVPYSWCSKTFNILN